MMEADWVKPWMPGYTTEKWGNIYMIFKGDEHIGFWCCPCRPDCQEIACGTHEDEDEDEEDVI